MYFNEKTLRYSEIDGTTLDNETEYHPVTKTTLEECHDVPGRKHTGEGESESEEAAMSV